MSDLIKHGDAPSHGSYERQDIGARGIIYFLLGLAAATLLIQLFLAGLYKFLDKRTMSHQPVVSPLLTPTTEDTRNVPAHYPEKGFPEPRLEDDERHQLDGVRMKEDERLNSYGWVDEKAGRVHIPIDRAMDLVVQRGVPVRQENASGRMSASSDAAQKNAVATNDGKRKKQ